MIEAAALIERFRYALDNAWGYIWGKVGILWTEAKQKALERSYELTGNTDLRYSAEYGSKWIGHYVADCSGLFVWAFAQLGGSIYHGSNTIWKRYCSAQGTLKNGARSDGQPIRPGTAVFLNKNGSRHHIGLYVGGNVCIEARGTKAGVVTSPLSHWDEWGELKDIAYDGEEGTVIPVVTLRRGMEGPQVVELQEMLNAVGYDCGASDGKFGARTETAVKAFQSREGLKIDGIVGPTTWERLVAAWEEAQLGGQPEPEPPEEMVSRPESTVVVTMSGSTYRALLAALQGARETDGGDDNA